MGIVSSPKDYQALFLDMNSFFASVEQQVQPGLRGKPVGVAPYTGSSGCIIAASYEAKRMGVKIGRVGDAKRLCPQIKIVESRPALYMIYHKEIKKVIESFSPYYKPLSIDEFVIHLTPLEQNELSARKLALALKSKISTEVGDYLKCSVGIAPSQFLAKVAGERQKPDGLTVVTLSDLKNLYQSISLTDIPGINWRLEKTLNRSGIYSPIQLFNLGVEEMMKRFGHWGRMWYFRLRGFEVDDVATNTRTIGHSHVLAPEFRTKDGAFSVLDRLIHKAGYRLRRERFWARGVAVSVRFLDKTGFSRGKHTSPFCDDKAFHDQVTNLLNDCLWQSRPIYVSVTAFDLVKTMGSQSSLFPEVEKPKKISETVDKINDAFGADTIYPASMSFARESAPDRIPFGKPRYEILH